MFQLHQNSKGNSLGSLWHNTRGVAAIEFAIMTSLLFIPFLGGVEVGYAAFQAMQVQSAAEAGALYASKNGFDPTDISLAVRNASAATEVTAVPAPSEFYGCPTNSGITPLGTVPPLPPPNCADGTSPGTYVQINATMTRVSLIPNSLLGLPPTFSAKSIVRLS